MARPREFDPDNAIHRAMEVFWMHGYDGASLPVLLDGMGLTRGSLYKAFEGKKPLFLRVLTLYEVEAVDTAVAVLSDDSIPDGLARIEAVFLAIPKAVASGDSRGCLLCSAAAGPASEDPDICEVVLAMLDKMRKGFSIALSAAGAGNHADQAEMLLAQYVGLRTLTRAGASEERLNDGVRATLALFRARV